MVNAISDIAASAAASIFGLSQATQQISLSTARLATGNRIIRPADDVGALTQSIKLQTNITTLRQALQNTTQADSLLQTAYTGLTTISDILTEAKGVATQANSGSLTAADRASLELQFQGLLAEVDSIANSTSFNSINLLDGSISEENRIDTYETAGTAASAELSFGVNIGGGQTIEINGTALTEGIDFAAGGSINASLLNVASAINTSSDLSINNIRASVVGTTLTLTERAGGTLGQKNFVDQGSSSAAFTTNGASTNQANVFAFQNGSDAGLTLGSVNVSGVSGDALVTTVSQTQGENRFSNFTTGNPTNNQTISLETGQNTGDIDFRFRTVPTAATTDVQIGATPEESLQNLIEAIENYVGTENITLDQMEFIREGQDLIIRNKLSGNGSDFFGNAFEVQENLTQYADNGNFLTGGTNTGVNVDGVTNKDFIGNVSGFSATYNNANDITASITVGDFTYEADITNTTPGADTFVRFKSTTSGGGYFDVEIASGGLAVADQNGADTFAARLDAAFGGLEFSQERLAESYIGVGTAAGSSIELERTDFSSLDVTRIDAYAAPGAGQDAVVEIEINGETFRTQSLLGDTIGARETIEFTSATTGDTLTYRNGATAVDLSTDVGAAAFESDLESSFGLGSGSGALNFQVSASSTSSLSVTIGSNTTDSLFDGASINVLTQLDAADAEDVLDTAIDAVSLELANVGALQQRALYAADALNGEIISKEEAYSALADTDVAFEATELAFSTVQAQSAIAVLAQTQALSSELLSLVKSGA